MNDVRVAVVDDHALFRAGLVSLLREMDEFQVVGEAGDGQGALELVRRYKPDVLLLDVNMPGMSSVDVVRTLRRMPQDEQCRIVMLTISKSEQDLLGAIQAGADGFLMKNVEPDELHKSIRLVHQGISLLSTHATRQASRAAMEGRQARASESGLSEREMEVLECLAHGRTTSQIASELFISGNTVKTHVRHILEKLDASNRAEAVSKAIQMGLIGSG